METTHITHGIAAVCWKTNYVRSNQRRTRVEKKICFFGKTNFSSFWHPPNWTCVCVCRQQPPDAQYIIAAAVAIYSNIEQVYDDALVYIWIWYIGMSFPISCGFEMCVRRERVSLSALSVRWNGVSVVVRLLNDVVTVYTEHWTLNSCIHMLASVLVLHAAVQYVSCMCEA